ncbi:uncharacterized protein PWA37_002139 [Arxiozyma heterogenica]|uniref:uncharacterized protein n=1 Tax=Arxiozyma heterogenica TaxID=278026 RepID=UPI002F19BBEF
MGRPKKEISKQNIERFQKELQLAGNRSDILLKDKRGRSKSCLLCKRRKQKCDQKLPSCTACLRAAVKCIQPAGYHQPTIKKTIKPSHDVQMPEVEGVEEQTDLKNSNSIIPLISQRVANTQKSTPSSKYLTPPASLITSPIVTDSPYSTTTEGSATNSVSHTITPFESSLSNHDNNLTIGQQKTGKPQRKSKGKVNKRYENSDRDQYTVFLERKLRYLEKLIDLPIGGAVFTKKLNHYKKITHLLGEIEDLESTVAHLPVVNNKNINNDNNRSPSNKFIPSSGVNNANGSIPALSSDSVDSIDFNNCIFAKYFAKIDFLYYPAFEFNMDLSRTFLDTFFTRLQFKYPLLDEEEIYSFHDNYAKNNIYSYSNTEFHFECGRMWLIFSIAACMQKTTGKYKGHKPIRYFGTAVRHITKCGGHFNDIHKIELLTLLVLYLIRTDRDSLVLYDIMKDIMDICKTNLLIKHWVPDEPFASKKLRLFWCVYLLERMICEAVSKPFTISESEINLPYFGEDRDNQNKLKQVKNIYFINQSLRLRRLESCFIEELQIFSDDSKESTELRKYQLPKVNEYFKQLELWRSTCSTTGVKNFENETLKLYYYRSVRLLIQPYLEFLRPEDRLFRECQAAAGQICQLYKIFHQRTIGGHSTPAIHTVFEAGVTLVYCMWLSRNYDDKRRKELGDESTHTRPLVSASLFSSMDDLRACSVCLYSMTERSKFARVFRDTFDELMNVTIGNLITRCGPNSSELIYISQLNKNITNNNIQSNLPEHMKKFEGSFQRDQSVDNNNDNELHFHGMPPAIKRVFGVGQAEEHAGFVEISQVDIEEQREFKKKQIDLEKHSLPKSLAHLLNHERKDSKIRNTSNTKINPDSTEQKQQQYVVKKPLNNNDLDWKTFHHQAYIQQQVAQQNLQNYLSSFNYAPYKPMSTYIIPNMQSNYDNNFHTNPINTTLAGNRHIILPPASNNSYNNYTLIPQLANSNPTNTFNIVTKNPNESSNVVNEPNLEKHTKNETPIDPNVSKTAQSLIRTRSGILINNWTHNMISSISNWTNDSLVDDVSITTNDDIDIYSSQSHQITQNHIITESIQQQPGNPHYRLHHHQKSFNLEQGNDLPMRRNNNYQRQITASKPLATSNSTTARFNAIPIHSEHWQHNNKSATVINSYPSITHNFTNNNNERNNNFIQNIPGRYREFENIGSVLPVEEFWTVNDDYGFLT